MAKKLERKILTNVKTAREGMVNLRQAEGLFHHEILSALAHGEVTRGSSLVLVGVQSALYYKRACEYLMGKLPKNASLRQASGNLGIDFVICGPLAPDWVDRNITNVYEGKSQIFTSWKRFNAERFHRYQGRNLEEGIDVNKTVFLESKDDIVSFLRPILRSRDRAFYICNPSSLPIRSFVSFIRPDGVDNWSEGAEQWLGRIREQSKLLEDVWDLYKVEVVKNESNDVNIRGAINNCSIVAILRFNDVEARNANAYEYSNSLRKFNEWRQSLSEHGLATVIHVAETLSMRESHEQYTVGGDIKGRLEKYSKSANFAFMGHETRNQEESLDLSMPLWNTIVFALAGTRKTLLAAHIAAAFLGSSFDVIYVSCKSASKLAYSKGFVSSDEFRYFAAPIKRLTGLITVPVKYYDLGKALSQPVIDGKARVLYTELIKDGGEDESAITRLGNVIPEESDGRQGRDVLLLFDELINYADWADPHALDYLIRIRDVLRSKGVRFVVLAQHLKKFYEAGESRREMFKELRGLLAECTVVVGVQSSEDESAYEMLLEERIGSAKVAENPPEGWKYNFAQVESLGKPIGKFFLLAKDQTYTSYPVPGLIPQSDDRDWREVEWSEFQ